MDCRAGALTGPSSPFLPQTEERRSKDEGADVPAGSVEDWLEKTAKRLSLAQSNRYVGLVATPPKSAEMVLSFSLAPLNLKGGGG